MVHIDLDDCQVGLLVHADDLGIVLHGGSGFVLQANPDAVGFLHHMAVGDDIAFRIDDHARTQRALADRSAITALPALAAEKAVEEVMEGTLVIALTLSGMSAPGMRVLHHRFGVDVDHTRLELLRDLGELVESCRGDGTVNGVASLFLDSSPLTPWDMTVPIKIPTERVARMVSV